MIIVKIITSLFVFAVGWKAIKLREPEYASGVPGKRKKLSCAVAIGYIFLAALLQDQETWPEALLSSMFWASMALCAWCDYLTTEIYDFSYLPAFISGCVMMWMNNAERFIPDVFIFTLIQFFVFRKLFGASDCIAYVVCALYMAAEGKEIKEYILLMLYVHLLFTFVQLFTGNISRKIKLKEPRPLVPCIAVVMLAIIWIK